VLLEIVVRASVEPSTVVRGNNVSELVVEALVVCVSVVRIPGTGV